MKTVFMHRVQRDPTAYKSFILMYEAEILILHEIIFPNLPLRAIA